jgi:hypothetical protein
MAGIFQKEVHANRPFATGDFWKQFRRHPQKHLGQIGFLISASSL